MRRLLISSLAAALFSPTVPCGASDVWESLGDGQSTTNNMLRPGLPQLQHDLEGTATAPDEDWMAIAGTQDHHSYEARVTGVYWDNGCGFPPCPRFDRVDGAGNVLTAGVVTNDDTSDVELARGLTVRWIYEAAPARPSALDGIPLGDFLRAIGDELVPLPAGETYDVEFHDTTLFVPRFNNSATQTTVFVIQNTTNITVTGSVYFYDTGGTLLSSVALNVVEHGVQVFNTAADPALAGKSGSATIAQLGGYGALTGKAVAVEPATGFTFDTAITPLSR
jgi:hypothetical protein